MARGAILRGTLRSEHAQLAHAASGASSKEARSGAQTPSLSDPCVGSDPQATERNSHNTDQHSRQTDQHCRSAVRDSVQSSCLPAPLSFWRAAIALREEFEHTNKRELFGLEIMDEED